ncbi:MAG: hypothetical protein H0U44_10895 [Flavisolibacter sp.]|jgi:hypothetical protein|nr:hypothetical protein [Flavisolibacter sp.]
MKQLLVFFLLIACNFSFAQEVLHFEKQRNLIPEGIAIHPTLGTIYISSIASLKIISIDSNGTAKDFIQQGQDGFLEGLGMKIDSKNNWLWALSNKREGKKFRSQVHAFDLASGMLMHRFAIEDTIPTLFNDLLIQPSGSLIISDTYHSALYSYDISNRKLEVLYKDVSALKWPNGMDFLSPGSIVVASYGNGLLLLDLEAKKTKPLAGFKDSSIAFGLDGLVMHGKFLYGVYNAGDKGHPSNAIIRYELNDALNTIISEKIVDRGNEAFADPTTAAIFGNRLFVIANSHLDQYNANRESVKGIEKELTPLKIVVYDLNK